MIGQDPYLTHRIIKIWEIPVKRRIFIFKKWLDLILLMTPDLVTIATDSNEIVTKMSLRNVQLLETAGADKTSS